MRVAVITNDLVTTGDAERGRRSGLIDPSLVLGVETGACPHTAIRQDPSANLDTAERLEQDHGQLDAIVIESGGDNLAATFTNEGSRAGAWSRFRSRGMRRARHHAVTRTSATDPL